MILKQENFKHYIDNFNAQDTEYRKQYIKNSEAWPWLEHAMPLFECPNKQLEETYYFRWWVYRKHLKKTSDGFVITEFLPEVPWSGKHNTINCAVGHHLKEGRWLAHSEDYLIDYINFWLKKGGDIRSYSSWFAYAIWDFCKVKGNYNLAIELLPSLISNFRQWEESNLHDSGLFWSYDDRDAMELSISGSGLRPTLNSYMYADALAISKIAELAQDYDTQEEFRGKANRIKKLVQEKLWDDKDAFFKVYPLASAQDSVSKWEFNDIDQMKNVREQIGFIPWYFNLPDQGYDAAWTQLFDRDGFYAPFGPTTAEQRHTRFMFHHPHECLWNGPSWPYATSQTLTALANFLNNYEQKTMTKDHYFELIHIYAKSHYRKTTNGDVSWLDENIHPYTGEWLSRKILRDWGWTQEKGGVERGKDYNHSTFNDLIINGLIGLRPQEDNMLHVHPLIPKDTWDYFCLDNIMYCGKKITVMYDKYGTHYNKGIGLKVYINGEEVGSSKALTSIQVML